MFGARAQKRGEQKNNVRLWLFVPRHLQPISLMLHWMTAIIVRMMMNVCATDSPTPTGSEMCASAHEAKAIQTELDRRNPELNWDLYATPQCWTMER